jgi:hypothetical protein
VFTSPAGAPEAANSRWNVSAGDGINVQFIAVNGDLPARSLIITLLMRPGKKRQAPGSAGAI